MITSAPRALRRTGVLAVAACVALTLAGCSGSVTADGTVAAKPSVACPPAQTSTTPGTQRTVVSDGIKRTYDVWLPTGYTGTTPVPLVVDFHGTGGDPLSYEQTFSSMGRDAPSRGYLLVAPQAIAGEATTARWRVPGTGFMPDDVKFTSDLLADVAKNYCVDQSRLYATGFSSGGAFTTYVACQLDVWAAVAPMAGVNLAAPCPDQLPLPMVTFHGTADETAAYTGLPGADDASDPTAFYDADVQKSVDGWAERNRCLPDRIDTAVVPTLTKRTYGNCTADTVLYIVDGAGHTYPGGPKLAGEAAAALGGQSQAIDAGKVLLDFFDAHRRVRAIASAPASALASTGGVQSVAPQSVFPNPAPQSVAPQSVTPESTVTVATP